jgi:pyridoxine/pyridoxamine 5'-phosphate oxidase
MTKNIEPNRDSALAQFLQHIWACLEEGAAPGRSPFTLVQSGTIGLDGAPQLRTVVLRQVRSDQNAVWFHSDARSPKVSELRADPRISLLAYDPQSQLQIRLEGVASISDDEAERRRMWTSSKAHTLVLYACMLTPSTAIASPEMAYPTGSSAVTAHDDGATNAPANAAPAITDPGYANFSLIRVSIERFDALHIKREGHQRAMFTYNDSAWQGSWLVP